MRCPRSSIALEKTEERTRRRTDLAELSAGVHSCAPGVAAARVAGANGRQLRLIFKGQLHFSSRGRAHSVRTLAVRTLAVRKRCATRSVAPPRAAPSRGWKWRSERTSLLFLEQALGPATSPLLHTACARVRERVRAQCAAPLYLNAQNLEAMLAHRAELQLVFVAPRLLSGEAER